MKNVLRSLLKKLKNSKEYNILKIINSTQEMQEYISLIKKKNLDISFIPTMGNLHDGHLSLIKKSFKYKTKRIVSIYINPLQFNDKNDYMSYPRTINSDIDILKELEIDCLFLPKEEINIQTDSISKEQLPDFLNYLCGKYRPGHFLGVYKIVKKLFDLIKPNYVFFGKKDFQQILLIKYLIKKHYKNLIHLICLETIRDKYGLALSSRNDKLTNKEKKLASNVSIELIKIKENIRIDGLPSFQRLKNECIKKLSNDSIKVEYLELLNENNLESAKNDTKNLMIFISFYLRDIRLIDNIKL